MRSTILACAGREAGLGQRRDEPRRAAGALVVGRVGERGQRPLGRRAGRGGLAAGHGDAGARELEVGTPPRAHHGGLGALDLGRRLAQQPAAREQVRAPRAYEADDEAAERGAADLGLAGVADRERRVLLAALLEDLGAVGERVGERHQRVLAREVAQVVVDGGEGLVEAPGGHVHEQPLPGAARLPRGAVGVGEDARRQRLGLLDAPELRESDRGDEAGGRGGGELGGLRRVEAVGERDDLLGRPGPDQGVGEQEARQPAAAGVAALGEARDGRAQQRDRPRGLGAAGVDRAALEQRELGAGALGLRQAREPAEDAVGGGPGEGGARGRDRAGGLGGAVGGEPVVDGLGGAAGALQGLGEPRVEAGAARAVAAVLAAAQEQGAEERVVADGAGGGARRAEEEAALADLGHEALGQVEGREHDRVELGGQGGVLQAGGEVAR